MNWKEIKDGALFLAIFILAICLIENDGDTLLVEIAGDLFGALGLMFLAVANALKDD